MSHSGAGTRIYGPYHREETPSQTKQTAALQVASQEIWGTYGRQSGLRPCVKAYKGALPPGKRGIQFETAVAPYPNSHPWLEVWPEGFPGVRDVGNGYVAISVTITLNTQVP